MTMIEKLARAIQNEVIPGFGISDLSYRQARACLTALLEPDEGMTRALYEAGANNYAYQSAIRAALEEKA